MNKFIYVFYRFVYIYFSILIYLFGVRMEGGSSEITSSRAPKIVRTAVGTGNVRVLGPFCLRTSMYAWA